MEHWLPRVLARIHHLARMGRIRFTYKALRELAGLGLGLDESDACEILSALTTRDWACRLRSEHTGEWMYVFKPRISVAVLYVKLIVRGECVVISFHEEVNERDEEEKP